MDTIEVPREWLEGLQKAVDALKVTQDEGMRAESIGYLLGYLQSIKTILK